jgi:CBS domain-containing protein
MSAIEGFVHKEMVTAGPDEPVAEVVRRMSKAKVGAVLLVADERLVGLFTERDLLTRVVAEGRDPEGTPVKSVATTDVIHAATGASIRACADQLKQHKVRHLPIVDGHRPIGIISARDFFETVSDRLEKLIEQARYDEQLQENADPYDHMGGGYGK